MGPLELESASPCFGLDPADKGPADEGAADKDAESGAAGDGSGGGRGESAAGGWAEDGAAVFLDASLSMTDAKLPRVLFCLAAKL